MKVLITGANGQLGKELTRKFGKDNKYELILTDINDLDISNLDDVKKVMYEVRPDIVINSAAYTEVDKCESEIDIAYKVNAMGPRNLAIVSEELSAKIIHISTDYVFDGNGNRDNKGVLRPYIEFDPPNPETIYGKTKLEGENFVKNLSRRYFIIRTAWLYGEGKNFLRTMLELSNKHNKLKVVNDQIGTPTSTYELANMIEVLMNTDSYGLYHGTCEGQCSWYDFAKMIFKIKQIDIEVEHCETKEFPRPAKRPHYSVLNNYMLKLNTNYKFNTWQDALEKFMLNSKIF